MILEQKLDISLSCFSDFLPLRQLYRDHYTLCLTTVTSLYMVNVVYLTYTSYVWQGARLATAWTRPHDLHISMIASTCAQCVCGT